MLASDSLTCRANGEVLVDGVSLTLAPGELVAIVGPNGAGKTTLLRAIGALLAPSAGTVHLDAEDLRRLSRRAIAQRIAMVPQHTDLHFEPTALELVLMGRNPHLGLFQMEGAADEAIARDSLRAINAADYAGRSVQTLSGGERQRVYIARALAQQPRLLLLDEPTANLDLVHQVRVMELVQRLATDQGLAVLAAIHDLTLAARYADRLILLSRGRVLAQGTAEEVLTESLIAAAFGVWASVDRHHATGTLTVTALAAVDGARPHPAALPEGEGMGTVASPYGRGRPGEAGPGEGGGRGEAGSVESRDSYEAPLEDLSDEGRTRKREEQAAARASSQRGAKGLVIVNTGNGKGKTTAALGLLFRAWGRGMRVVMFQFIKAQTANWGESRAAKKIGVEIVPLGDGFTWMSKDVERSRALAHECWHLCRERIERGEDDIVIMDEMTYCFSFGWLDLDEVLDVLRKRRAGMHVIITGRDAPEGLIEFADLVTEMREVKHPYRSGVLAQPGIEF